MRRTNGIELARFLERLCVRYGLYERSGIVITVVGTVSCSESSSRLPLRLGSERAAMIFVCRLIHTSIETVRVMH